MAYNSANLSALGYSNGFTLWHYRTTDVDDAEDHGYFNPANRMLRVGDMIHLHFAEGTDAPTYALGVVTKNAQQEVEVTVLAGIQRDPEDGEYYEIGSEDDD